MGVWRLHILAEMATDSQRSGYATCSSENGPTSFSQATFVIKTCIVILWPIYSTIVHLLKVGSAYTRIILLFISHGQLQGPGEDSL